MLHSRKLCTGCKKPLRNAPVREIPIVSAVIALVFCAVVIFGAAAALLSRTGPDGDAGLHLDGIWEIESPTYNDEHITYVFAGDTFSSVTETMIFNASPEMLEDIAAFHREYSGAYVSTEGMGEGNYLLRITIDGTFFLDGYHILMVSGYGIVRLLSFNWEGEAIVINGYRFVRG